MFQRTVAVVLTTAFLDEILAGLFDTGEDGEQFVGLRARFSTLDIQPNSNHTWATYEASLADIDSAGPGIALDDWTDTLNLPGRRGRQHQVNAIAGAAPTSENLQVLLLYRQEGYDSILVGMARLTPAVPVAVEGDFASIDVVVALPTTLPSGLA